MGDQETNTTGQVEGEGVPTTEDEAAAVLDTEASGVPPVEESAVMPVGEGALQSPPPATVADADKKPRGKKKAEVKTPEVKTPEIEAGSRLIEYRTTGPMGGTFNLLLRGETIIGHYPGDRKYVKFSVPERLVEALEQHHHFKVGNLVRVGE